ncbi:peptidoglycan D,D-transpeptidase FtsI family protein [Actinoalloteichus spitiensis]|uniref:peptidoglycan D,D-transpeptidase FtsI family protein n=1 Tax=Actinoalloteichus spitiensis TaxID=252394 RepID=UPI000375CEC4|nr:penicillin-binding protein 2 [Actinoalloteichus spitiensis]
MNTPLRRVSLFVMLLVVALMANLTYIQVIKADEYRTDPRNSTRKSLEEYSRKRGDILAGDEVIASAVETGGRLRFQRTYSDGPVYAPITGFFSDRFGSRGIEAVENDVLNGSDDRLFVRRLSDLITGRDPEGGKIRLTVDPHVQRVAYDQLADRGFTGAIVALDPKTGAVLAMANTPSYDPSPLADHDNNVQAEAWAEYTEREDGPMQNRAIREIQPPGSTFKLITAAAALENGWRSDTGVSPDPVVTLPNTSTDLPNFNRNPCGIGQSATLKVALAESCNVPFAEISGELGADTMRETARAFGFDEELFIPVRVEASSMGELGDAAQLYQAGIGQRDVRVTPMQNALMAATIANGGTRMAPYLVDSILGPDLSTLDSTSPDELNQAISPETAATLTDMMIASEEYTGGGGDILPNVTVASKTGTAQWGTDPGANPPHAWYVAFAPAEDPQVAVAVLVESGGDHSLGATGGKVAAPLGREVMRAALGGG